MNQPPLHQAEPCIPCVDVWPLEKMTGDVRGAYNALARRGEIYVQKITVKKSTGMVILDYLSTMPQDWTRQALKKAKEDMKNG